MSKTRPDPGSAFPDESWIKSKGGCDSPVLLKKYVVKITDTVKDTITGDVHNDPVARQYIPQSRELKILPGENTDPIGDEAYTPVKGIVHRHPDRVLFKPANVCAVYCRYCFRREKVGPGSDVLNKEERHAALDYIRQNKDIWEVILTGGDPLVLSPRQLGEILDELETIRHVQVLRIHTRIPVADPGRVTQDLLGTLRRKTPVYMAIHVNHVQEITPKVERTLENLRKAGCTLLSQSVLLKGVNDNAKALEDLFRKLVALHVKPYYLHHPDMAPGTSHFRLSLREGQKIMKELQGRVSGLCLPHYMLDIPGGHGKVPVNPCYLQELENGAYMVENHKGVNHYYPPKE